MPRPARRAVALLAACALLPTAACAPSSSAAPESDALPGALAVRSDTPYITGTIVRRDGAREAPRLLVRAPADPLAGAARVREAVVSVHPDSLLTFRDGRAATAGDLVVGRAVVAWVHGPELRSLPPQVTASAILVERR